MSETLLFKKWINFFYVVRDKLENKEAISDYLFSEFSGNPDTFYRFIEYLKRKIKNSPGKDSKLLAKSYLSILSPLCERFGFYGEKDKLDDLCFHIVDPSGYEKIDNILKTYKDQSKDIIHKISVNLKRVLDESEYKYEINGRYKSICSIQRKLKNKPRKTVLSLKDIFAFRIILKNNSIDECFDVMNLLHDDFYPIVDYFKDYISIPKINGYQSLHTGLTNVIPNLDLPVEVQIRTEAMDEFAEKGMAAHWIYSKVKKARMISEKEKMLLEYMSSFGKSEHINEVYFFSHQGDVFHLEEGSSVLDFAYFIHTDLGDNMAHAIVNGKKKSFDYKIENGDRIKIVKNRKYESLKA